MKKKFKVIPIAERNDVQIDGLYDNLKGVIFQHAKLEALTMAEIIGTLEILKIEILEEYE